MQQALASLTQPNGLPVHVCPPHGEQGAATLGMSLRDYVAHMNRTGSRGLFPERLHGMHTSSWFTCPLTKRVCCAAAAQGAATLGLSLRDYLSQLRASGLGSLPGTAAEVLDDGVRGVLCPDKVNTQQWLEVVETGVYDGVWVC